MFITVFVLLLIFVFNVCLALTALQAIATGIVQMYGKTYSRERDNYEFWFSIAAKATAAIIFFLYLSSVVSQLSQPPTSARVAVEATKKA